MAMVIGWALTGTFGENTEYQRLTMVTDWALPRHIWGEHEMSEACNGYRPGATKAHLGRTRNFRGWQWLQAGHILVEHRMSEAGNGYRLGATKAHLGRTRNVRGWQWLQAGCYLAHLGRTRTFKGWQWVRATVLM